MKYKITMAQVCELAHTLTELRCSELNINIGTRTLYSKKAKRIFDKYFDLITKTLDI